MNDFAFYWKNFARENKRGDWPCKAWYSPSDAITKKIEAGDRVWLFTSGEACGLPEARAGFLVEVFFLKKAIKNTGEDKEYPTNQYHFLLVADPDKIVKVEPPLNVDAIVRPSGHDADEPIGKLLTNPRQLKTEAVDGLLAALKEHRAALAPTVVGA